MRGRVSSAVFLMLVAGCDRGSLGVWSVPGQHPADAATEPDAAPGPAERDPTSPPVRGQPTPLDAPDAALPDAGVDLAPDEGQLAPDLAPDRAPDLRPDLAPDAAPQSPLSCKLTPSPWIGCNAACGVCGEMVAAFGRYQQNHPRCKVAATSCDGAARTCTSDCPLPTVDDLDCGPAAGGWVGCIASGCAIDPAYIADYPGYLEAHPFCNRGNDTHSGNRVGCSAACPKPGESDRLVGDGSSDGWVGCRGYGLWVCVELLEGYPRYLKNHPFCVANGTCDGLFALCNDACPAPGPADR